ncbi:RNA polymerase sigma factor SigF [Nocardia sp. NPDC050406]|uniref:RNA polymerase sigma factor SigF n=1 Tax=Nocardia sp. NPDC050406 TaxID=3364318 RepID=UPI00378C45FB
MPITDSRQRRAHRAPDTYDNIEPWFEKLAATPANDPEHKKIRDHILELCLPLAEHIARRFTGRGEEFDDLHQIATLGLVLAVDRFDVSRGSSFLSFAVPTIMGEVRRHFRDHTWALRVPRHTKEVQRNIGPAIETLAQRLGRMPTAREIAAELEVELTDVTRALVARNAYRADSLDAVVQHEDDTSTTAVMDSLGAEEPCYQLTEDAMTVRPLIAALPERQRRVLTMRYYKHMTQTEIASDLHVSQMQVSRILSKTLATLRKQALADVQAA